MPQTPKSFQQVLQELWELLKTYARQETIGPLQNLKRQLGYGIGGTFLFALGWFLITLGVIRMLQTQKILGNWFIDHDYFQYLVAVIMLTGLCVWAGLKAKGKGSSNIVTPAETGIVVAPVGLTGTEDDA